MDNGEPVVRHVLLEQTGIPLCINNNNLYYRGKQITSN